MIVGTGGFARDNYGFDSVAANLGYHVIGLDYNNTVITTTCSNSSDSTCFNTFRQEIVFGTDLSPLVSVDSLNAIYFRIKALLGYLARQHSEQGWKEFIKGDSIQWSKIIVAGHSQGAGHAAYLGKRFPVARVLILAGPQDFLSHFNTPASWLSEKSITPPGKYFAFLHLKDPFDFKKQLADCMKLMQLNSPDSILIQPNTSSVNLLKFHILVTDISSGNPHGSMLQPVFVDAWKYLLQFPSDKIKE
jgi:pimeloyl-ACP methyl ester carboxylesterase